ncbi:MAG: DMT family transporter [Sandaracinus sp.]|nr:DMT family transporter [Sandaracinus sp.]
MSDARSIRRARIAVAVGVTAIAFAAIFFRRTAPTPPIVAAGLRLVLASMLFAPFAGRSLTKLTPTLWRDATLGGLCYALHFGAWVSSLALTTVAASVTLVTATPLLLALVAFATGKDRPTRRQWLALPIALLGTAMLGGSDAFAEGALLGDVLSRSWGGGRDGGVFVDRAPAWRGSAGARVHHRGVWCGRRGVARDRARARAFAGAAEHRSRALRGGCDALAAGRRAHLADLGAAARPAHDDRARDGRGASGARRCSRGFGGFTRCPGR